MKRQLNQVLLIDDSAPDNFIHRRHIEKAGIAKRITVKENGKAALEYLTKANEQGAYEQPELIFLDINMPVMNGWEFLDAYNDLLDTQKGKVVLAMLTTSSAARDRKRAKEYNLLDTFIEKPLTQEDLRTVVMQNFPELYEEE